MSLSLEDIADTVTRKVGQKEATDIADCKLFAAKRYQMIWNEALWKDSIHIVNFTLNVTTNGVVSDINQNGNGMQGFYLLPASLVDRVLAIRTLTRPVFVSDNENVFASLVDVFNQTGDPASFQIYPQVVWQFPEETPVFFAIAGDVMAGGRAIYINSSGQTDGGININDDILVTEFRSITKPATDNQLAVEDSGSTQLYFVISAAEGPAPIYRRIRILPVPTVDTEFNALVKTPCPSFTDDRDMTAINGVDNCLMEFVEADMLRRSRQHAKADLADKRGGALLEQLKRMETVQMAHNKRIEPADGYGTVTQQLGWDTHKF